MKRKEKGTSKVVGGVRTERTASVLTTRAMLANLSVGVWEGRKKDKETSEEVVDEKGAQKDAAAVWVRTIAPSALKDIGRAVSRGRGLHFRYTLAWDDKGPRILPAAMFMDYSAEMRKLGETFQAAVDAFLAEYPVLVDQAGERLGHLADNVQFPTVQELRRKFYWRVGISPLPDAADFRVDLGEDVTETVKREIEEQANASMNTAMMELFDRLHKAVSKMAERLGDADAIVRDSLVENLADLCELLPKMNVTGDPRLTAMRDEVMKKLTSQEPEALRKNKTVRADTAKAAQDILKRMEGYMGR